MDVPFVESVPAQSQKSDDFTAIGVPRTIFVTLEDAVPVMIGMELVTERPFMLQNCTRESLKSTEFVVDARETLEISPPVANRSEVFAPVYVDCDEISVENPADKQKSCAYCLFDAHFFSCLVFFLYAAHSRHDEDDTRAALTVQYPMLKYLHLPQFTMGGRFSLS